MEASGSDQEQVKRRRAPPKQYMTNKLLIEAIRENPPLWDEALDEYKDRDLKKKLWNEVAASFIGGSPKDVVKSWNTLRRCLANQRLNYLKRHGVSGSAAVPYKPYKYETEMLFLDGLKGVDKMEGSLEASRADDISGEAGVDQPSAPAEEEEAGSDEEIMNAMDYSQAMADADDSIPSRPILQTLNYNGQSPVPKPSTPSKMSPSKAARSFGNKENVLTPSKHAVVQPGVVMSKLIKNGPVKNKDDVSKKRTLKEEKSNPSCKIFKASDPSLRPLESPAAKKARLKKEKQERLDKQREDVLQKLALEVEKASMEKSEEKKMSPVQSSEYSKGQGCTCSSAVEEAILAELRKTNDDAVVLFLLSMADSVRALPAHKFRKFQLMSLNILSELEDSEAASTETATNIFQLTKEEQATVDKILAVEDDAAVAIISDLLLTGRDVKTVGGSNWLNDMVINAYLMLIASRSKNEGVTVFAFNTFFIENLLSCKRTPEENYESVSKWFMKLNTNVHEFVFIPVHDGDHWSLIVINIVERKITYSCSMRRYSTKTMAVVEMYFSKRWGLTDLKKERGLDMPRQTNCNDCGVFICMYANYISLGEPINFSQTDIPTLRKRMIYELINTKLLRVV